MIRNTQQEFDHLGGRAGLGGRHLHRRDEGGRAEAGRSSPHSNRKQYLTTRTSKVRSRTQHCSPQRGSWRSSRSRPVYRLAEPGREGAVEGWEETFAERAVLPMTGAQQPTPCRWWWAVTSFIEHQNGRSWRRSTERPGAQQRAVPLLRGRGALRAQLRRPGTPRMDGAWGARRWSADHPADRRADQPACGPSSSASRRSARRSTAFVEAIDPGLAEAARGREQSNEGTESLDRQPAFVPTSSPW